MVFHSLSLWLVVTHAPPTNPSTRVVHVTIFVFEIHLIELLSSSHFQLHDVTAVYEWRYCHFVWQLSNDVCSLTKLLKHKTNLRLSFSSDFYSFFFATFPHHPRSPLPPPHPPPLPPLPYPRHISIALILLLFLRCYSFWNFDFSTDFCWCCCCCQVFRSMLQRGRFKFNLKRNNRCFAKFVAISIKFVILSWKWENKSCAKVFVNYFS